MKLKKFLEKKQKILIAGFGYRTGLQTANFLLNNGHDVEICDLKDKKSLSGIESQLVKRTKVYYENQDSSLVDNGYSLIIISPGVPTDIDLINDAKKKGVIVASEVELAFNYMKGKWIAITGTDGKSTTATMTAEVLEKLGQDVQLGGNIGIPLISLINNSNDESVTVAELSSFQLENVEEFNPDVSTIINISPDHLDRYNSMYDYITAKQNIYKNHTSSDYHIINLDCKDLLERLKKGDYKVMAFSMKRKDCECFFCDDTVFYKKNENHIKLLNKDEMSIPGIHNIQNAMVCALLVKSYFEKTEQELDCDKLADALTNFKGLEHRMEIFAKHNGITFINDSKATTIKAVEMAAAGLSENSVFILGGRAKGDDYSVLKNILKKHCKAVILIGETKEEFSEIFKGFKYKKVENLDDAVEKAYKLCSPGGTVILSPACASFDMFKSFEERGRVFKNSVNSFIGGENV